MALVSRLHNPACLRGLLEMHLEPRQIHTIQVTYASVDVETGTRH